MSVQKMHNLGYKPKCPSCKEEVEFDVAVDDYLFGANGQYEFVICKAAIV
jgi:hypothetical protein